MTPLLSQQAYADLIIACDALIAISVLGIVAGLVLLVITQGGARR